MQIFGTGALLTFLGPAASLSIYAFVRVITFSTIPSLQTMRSTPASIWYHSAPNGQILTILWFDVLSRLVNQTVSKISKETLWSTVPMEIKYRAKIVVDVFAYRLGTGLAALLGNIPINEWIPALHHAQSHIVTGVLMCIAWLYTAAIMGTEIVKAVKKKEMRGDVKVERKVEATADGNNGENVDRLNRKKAL